MATVTHNGVEYPEGEFVSGLMDHLGIQPQAPEENPIEAPAETPPDEPGGGKPVPTKPAPVDYKALNDQYTNAYESYGQSMLKKDTVDYSKSPQMKIAGGKDPGITVPVQILKDVVSAAKRNKVDPYTALAQVNLESSFGTNTGAGYGKNDMSKSSKTDIVQGWDLDESNKPTIVNKFLEQHGVPGVKAIPDKAVGYRYELQDESKVNQYLAQHPEIVKAYQEHLKSKSIVPPNYDTYDAAMKRDLTGIKHYNPDPAYQKNLEKYAAQFRADKSIQAIVDGMQ